MMRVTIGMPMVWLLEIWGVGHMRDAELLVRGAIEKEELEGWRLKKKRYV